VQVALRELLLLVVVLLGSWERMCLLPRRQGAAPPLLHDSPLSPPACQSESGRPAARAQPLTHLKRLLVLVASVVDDAALLDGGLQVLLLLGVRGRGQGAVAWVSAAGHPCRPKAVAGH